MSAKDECKTPVRPDGSPQIDEAQVAVERRAATLHAMYDRAFAFVGLLDAEGRLLDANRRALDFAGIALADVVGQPFWETPWWAACEASREKLRAAIERGRNGEFSRFEAVHINGRGDRVDVDFTLTPILNEAGNVVQLQPEGRDITEAKRATEALRLSEERLRLATEAAGIGTFSVDVERKVAHYSPELAALLGFQRATHVALEDAFARVYRDDVERVRAEYAAALRPDSDGSMKTELRFVRPGGEVRWMWFNGRVKFRGEGTHRIAVQIIGACRDITDRKRAEAALRESEERYRSLVEQTVDGIFVTDPSGRYLDANAAGVRMLGYSLDELRELTIVDVIAANEVSRVPELIARMETGNVVVSEWTFCRKDGSTFPGEGVGRRLPDGRMLGILRDVSERKRSEQALRDSEALYRTTLQALPAHIAVIDRRGRIQAVNEAWIEFAHENNGRGPGLSVGANYLDVCRAASDASNADAAAALAGIEKVLAGSGRQFSMEYSCDSPTEQRCFQMNVVALGDRDHGGAVVLHTNITDRRRAQDVLANSNRELEARVVERTRQLQQEMKLREETQTALAQAQRMEALGQLTGGIAHDFNNLLTVISGNLELAEAHIAGEKARRSVRQAIEAVEMGASLNRRLLSFARRRKLAPQHLVLNERVSEMLKLLRRTLGEEVTLSTSLDATLWSTQVDPGEIDSAIINIAINARDAMPSGGTLTLTTRNVTLDATAARETGAQPGDYVCLTLTDTGHGMTPEVLRRAIEPFFTTKETGKGTGLGLSSVYGFARQSGGFIDIASEVGRGTSVSIFLPRVPAEIAVSGQERAKGDVTTGDGELILVVEDNDQVRQVTLARLESLGYDVMEARSGPEAVELMKAQTPVRLVFTDVVMPGGMSGYDVARWAKTARPELKVLLTSGNEAPAREASADVQGLRVLAKPYTRAQLGHAIRDALAG